MISLMFILRISLNGSVISLIETVQRENYSRSAMLITDRSERPERQESYQKIP
jgi:hypothetical protein